MSSNLCISSTAINGPVGAAGTHPCTEAELRAGTNVAHPPAASPPPPPAVAQAQRPVEQSYASRIFQSASSVFNRAGQEVREAMGSVETHLDSISQGATNLWESGNGN